MDRDRYLHYLRDRRARFHAVLDELGLSLARDADLRREVGGGWPLGEHLVHLAAWQRRYARVVSGAPKLPYPSNWQKFNDAVYAEWRGGAPGGARGRDEGGHRRGGGRGAGVGALPPPPPGAAPDRPGLREGGALSAWKSHYREHAAILLEYAGKPKPPPWRGRVVD